MMGSAASPRVKAASLSYFPTLCVGLVAVNVCAFWYHYLGAQVFGAVGNAISIGLISYSLFKVAYAPEKETAAPTYLLLALAAVPLSVIYNFQVASTTDALKYLSIYIFYAAGRACGGRMTPLELRCMWVLGALPIVFLVTKGTSKVYENESFAHEIFSYFPNANTGVLYFSALLFAVTQLYGNRVIAFQFVNAIIMNKLGAVVATAVAACIWIAFPLRRDSFIALLVVVSGAAAALSIGAFDRGIATVDNVMLVFSGEPSAIASMSYKQLVQMTGSTDLSAFFRLIHWSEIWSIYVNQGSGVLLLGYGAGQTPFLTYASLVAHNDYLRILAEYGVINAVIFILFLIYVYNRLPSGAPKVLFVVLCIYFFSENLLDNFTSMAVYFGYAGRLSAATEQKTRRRFASRASEGRVMTLDPSQ